MTRKSLFEVLAFVVMVSIIAFVLKSSRAPSSPEPELPKTMTFSKLVEALEASPESIKTITVLNGSNEMKIENAQGGILTVVVPSKAGEALVLAKAEQAKVAIVASEDTESRGVGSIALYALLQFLPMLLFFLFIFWIIGRIAKNAGPGQFQQQMSRRKTQEVGKTAPRKTFADVAGCDEAKIEAEEIIRFLRNPGHYHRMGARAPKGVLLVGPPGTGKTLLAKAIAGEAGANFFDISASEFVEMFVGVGAARVRSLFKDAGDNTPSVIFIDEIDAVGRQRGAGVGGGHDEREQTLNQLLTEMDGFNTGAGVIILAATNRPDVLDPALVRPGRFDRQILVDAPDVVGREAIFKIHTMNKPLADSVNLKLLAERCPGFTGADIEGSCNEAATMAIRRIDNLVDEIRARGGNEQEVASVPNVITLQDFDEGIDRVTLGVAKTSRAKTMSREDMLNTSVHELGHALITELLLGGDPVTKITIIPRSRALGYTQSNSAVDRYGYNVEQLYARILMIMGGRAAQEVLLNTVDTGASNDFQRAYELARRMVTEWGMSPLGPISVSGNTSNPFLGRAMSMPSEAGPKLQDRIDNEIQCILNACLERARALVKEYETFMKAANSVLLKKETLLAPDWQALLAEHKVPVHTIKAEINCGTCKGHSVENPITVASLTEPTVSDTPAADAK